MSITGGIVRYEDGVKTTAGDQFSPTRKVAVELHFSTPEDGDGEGETQVTLDKAQAFVNGKLGVGPEHPVRTKADLEAEAVAKVDKPKRGPGRPKVDPAIAVTAEVVVASAPISEPADEWATEAVTEVTDKDLNDEVQKKNAVLKDPVKIRTLIATFSPDPKKPFTLREIPQGQRQTFIDKLKALA